MTVKDLTAQDLAIYARYALGQDDYDTLPEPTKNEVALALSAAKGYVEHFTGVDLSASEAEDLTAAVLVVGTEMLDNRQMTAQYGTQNPMVMQILNLHSVNLLPEVDDDADL